MSQPELPPGQQLVAAGKWPLIGECEPRHDVSAWVIAVHRGPALLGSFTLEELRGLGVEEQCVDIHCVTRWSKLGVRFEGIRLATILRLCGLETEDGFVSFVARTDRHHSTSLPLRDALRLGTLLAVSADGAPLGKEHGGPIRVVVPGRYFYKSLKWLERIDLLAEDRLGYWERTAGYHNEADPWLEQRYLAGGISPALAQQVLRDRDLAGRELRGLTAAGLDLTGLVASHSLLRNADLRGCQLAGASFVGANLSNAHFQGANLRDASFRSADLEGADFSGADLRGCDLREARMLGVSFVDRLSGSGAIIDAQTRIDVDALHVLTPDQHDYLREALRSWFRTPEVDPKS